MAAGGGPGNGAQLAGPRRRLPRTLLRAEQQTGKEPHSRPLPRGTRFLHLLVPDGIPARPEGVRRQKGLAPGRRHQLPCGDLAQRQHGGQHGRHVPAARHRHHRQGHLRPGECPGREGLSRGHAGHDPPQGRQVVRRKRRIPERRQRRDRPQRHPADDRRMGLLLPRRHPRPQHRHLARHLHLHHRAGPAGTPVRQIRTLQAELRRGAPDRLGRGLLSRLRPAGHLARGKGERRNPGRGHPLREGGETLPRRGEAGRLHPRGVPAARDPQPAPVVAAEQREAGTVRPDAEGRIRR